MRNEACLRGAGAALHLERHGFERHHGNRQEAVGLRPGEALPGAVGEKDHPQRTHVVQRLVSFPPPTDLSLLSGNSLISVLAVCQFQFLTRSLWGTCGKAGFLDNDCNLLSGGGHRREKEFLWLSSWLHLQKGHQENDEGGCHSLMIRFLNEIAPRTPELPSNSTPCALTPTNLHLHGNQRNFFIAQHKWHSYETPNQ